jgi:hypothetical protein
VIDPETPVLDIRTYELVSGGRDEFDQPHPRVSVSIAA